MIDLEPPHQLAFKCTPESFAELDRTAGIIPAPYMARNMWVQEQELGETLDRRELAALVKASYEPRRREAAEVLATRGRSGNATQEVQKELS